MAKSKDTECKHGLMEQNTKVNGRRICSMEPESTYGHVAKNMKGDGKIISNMENLYLQIH